MSRSILPSLVPLALCAAGCGPMYQSPGGQQQPQPPAASPAEASGPPGGAADPWTEEQGMQPELAAAPSRAKKPKPQPKRSGLPATAQEMLDLHNTFRAKHCAAPLTWSPKLAEIAQQWANTLKSKGCAFEHSQGSKYGENLAAGTTGAMGPEVVVTMWYDEVKGYSFKQPGFSMQTGHFTQVVWRDTKSVGCGMAQCKGMDVWVCNYDPPGNWAKQYREQVLPTSCKK